MSGNEDEERSPRIFDRRRRQNSLGSTTGPDSEDEGLGYDDYKSFPLSSIQEQDVSTPLPSIQEQEESVAQGLSASVAGPGESEEAQQNIEFAEIFSETMQPIFVEILKCYKDGFEYISTTPYKTVLSESEKYNNIIMGDLVDRMVCAAIPTFFPTELPNFDPYLASALIKRVLPRVQSFIDGYICDAEGEPEMTEQEMRNMISNIMPLTPVTEAKFEQLCSNFLRVRKEAVAAIGKTYSPKNPSMSEIKDFSSASYVYPEIGGKKQTKKYKKMRSRKTKKSRKSYRGGQRWRIYFMGFLMLMFVIGILITLCYTQYELMRIKDQVNTAKQTILVKKIFDILKMMQKGETSSESTNLLEFEGANIPTTTSIVAVSDKKEYPLSITSREVSTIDKDFLDELQENEGLFLQLQTISKTDPYGLIYLYMSGGFTITSFDVLNDITARAADFLLKGIETVESAKIKRELLELQKGFENFVEVDENAVLSKFFSECYAAEIGSGSVAEAHSLLYVAENYEDYYNLVTKLRIQKLMPKPEVVKRFTNGLVKTLVEQSEESHITDPVTGIQGDQTPVNPARALFDMVPGLSTITKKFDSMSGTVKKMIVTKELADEKATCFVRTMQSISTRKFAELDALKADLKILQLDIGDLIGVEIVKNAFYFILPKGARLFSCYKVLTCLISLFAASITTYGIYKSQEEMKSKAQAKAQATDVQLQIQGATVAEVKSELVAVKRKVATSEEEEKNRVMSLLTELLVSGNIPGFPAQPGAQGNNSNSNSNSNSSSSNLGEKTLFVTKGKPAPLGRLEEELKKRGNKSPGKGRWLASADANLKGGRTKKRRKPFRRQTKKRRIVK